MEAALLEPMLPSPFRVRRNRKETSDTRTLELEPRGGVEVPPWRPGQFFMLYAFGAGEIPISISGDPAKRSAIVGTVRAVGNVSRAICGARPGSAIGVRGPFGTAWPIEECEGRDVVLVAGGTGLAPLRPAVHAILAARVQFGRVALLIGARSPESLLYRREMDRWRRRGLEVRVTVDSARPGWTGSVGPVTAAIPRGGFDPARALAFVVGPEAMMRYAVEALRQRGVPPDCIYVSMERNMKCAIGFCGHCQLGPAFICKDGPVFPWPRLEPWLAVRSL
jgi:NAD(P)H-flavin reductase